MGYGPEPAPGPVQRQVLLADEGMAGSSPSDLARMLYAAKPVTWRGRGDLAQVPWTSVPRGTWLVLDLWSGYGGLCLALLQLGMTFYAVAAECDQVARDVACKNLPHLLHVPYVEELRAADFVPFLRRRNVRGVLMGGGSPCQGNSALNVGRRGLADPRSCQPLELQRLRDEFLALPEMANREVLVFLENVASMPTEVRQQYSSWLGGAPILIDSGTCGWVQRRRLYWLVASQKSLCAELQPPSCWGWVPAEGEVAELRYQGEKPLPNKCFFYQGFKPLLDPKDVIRQHGRGAIHPFTREFFHPADRTAGSSAAAVARFFEDNRRFPPSAYEDRSLVWRSDEWRPLLPSERAQLMGVPPDSFENVPGDPHLQRQRQNSLLGNGFHLFSILAVFCFLPQLVAAKLPPSLSPVDEVALQQRLLHTAWEPGRLDHFPGLLTSADIARTIPELFPECVLAPDTIFDLQRRLSHCDLPALQGYYVWRRLRGLSVDELGPQHLTRRDRATIYCGLTGQRHAADSSKGLDHLLPPGLGKTGHIAASESLSSPFVAQDWPEQDVTFVLDAVCTWRTSLPAYAAKLRHILKTVATATAPLEQALEPWRVESAARVATAKRPGFVAVMSILLRWPDLFQAQCMVRGYPIVGEIESSGLFRPVAAKEVASLDNWLEDAKEKIDAIVHSRPPLHADDIFEQTVAEQNKGFCSKFYSRSALDSMFGCNQWRPLERFQIVQADNKRRMIDNARRTEHNAYTSLSETIFTVSIDFVASVAAALCRRLGDQAGPPEEVFQWLRLRLGTDDLPDAYRGLPVRPDHQRFSVVAIYVPGSGWKFTLLWGLAFGLESAVVSFNRLPQLGVAVARRCTLSIAAAYFDDELAVETIADADVSQRGLRLAFCLMGATPQPEKGFSPTANRHYLGTSLHTGDLPHLGVIRVQPKASTTTKVLAKLDDILQAGTMSRDEASKLRGDVTWLFTMCLGHLGKFAGPVLSSHQYGNQTALTPSDRRHLEVLRQAVLLARPRDIPIFPNARAVTRIYSDASFEQGVLRLGWIIFPPASTPVGGTCVVPPSVIATWKERSQQIFPGETLCALVVPLLFPTTLRGCDALWFLDNESAVSALIRASCSEDDVLLMVQRIHLQFHALQMRTWFEWIDSESNPADGLSRSGLDDEWTLSQPWQVQDFEFPFLSDPATFLES